ncbi:MAG: aspartate--tRNA ligase [Acidimicrobiia bacterium]|nr:aspartate--tRNA ligase [Acidimicrobiia bacterium]
MTADLYRTTRPGLLGIGNDGETVQVAGWVQTRRDHGGIVFLDVRDATGLVQVVVDPEGGVASEEVLAGLRREYVVSVLGVVTSRGEGHVNPDIASGEIEIAATELHVLSPAETLPFQLDGRVEVDEALRLQYRYLDLRRPEMAANLKARSDAIRAMRRVLDEKDFLEVETPTLVASTPEGARDVLVPSRLRQGHFYALPQSPQLFKQLLMISGVDRYFQIARCYRDEDFRADRQIEFTQLDLEGAFWGQEDVLEVLEEVAVAVTKEVRGVELSRPFPRLTWQEAMDRYGTDKPDIRFEMEISDLSSVFSATEFKAFAGVLGSGGTVRGINAGPKGLTRAGLDALVERATSLGAKGLVWMVVEEDGSLRSPVAKFLSDEERHAIKAALGAQSGDLILIVADQFRTVAKVLGALRLDMGQPEGHNELVYLFVTDFPVFEEAEDGSYAPMHHPFTAPESVEDMVANPATAVSKAYDVVLNGSELGSGSVRIHDPAVQSQVFEVLGITAEDAARRFGWFMDALRYGTPPHAGFAFGIDRMVSILQGEPNIREVIPFPKTQTGSDPLTGSPSRVEDAQLGELGIKIAPDVLAAWAEQEQAE